MVGTISPLVQVAHENRRGLRPLGLSVVYLGGSLIGGIALYLVVRPLHWMMLHFVSVETLRASFPVLACIAALVAFAQFVFPILPMRDRQVPQGWRERFAPAHALAAYSAILGFGLLTRINSPGFYLIPFVVIVSPTETLAILVVLLYAAARAIAVIVPSLALRERFSSSPERVLDTVLGGRLSAVAFQGIAMVAVATLALSRSVL